MKKGLAGPGPTGKRKGFVNAKVGGQSTPSKNASQKKSVGTNAISGKVRISQGGEGETAGLAAGKAKALKQQRISNGTQNFRG